jgi:hypothetical protein
MAPQHLVVFSLDTLDAARHNARQPFAFLGWQGALHRAAEIWNFGCGLFVVMRAGWPLGRKTMQYLPGFTVQCINPGCDARGHWLRADATGPISDDGRCPCCGDMLRNVPPPLGPRFRMRPRALTARPPLRPRPR